jgi:DNA-binding NtrC family response regulator
MESPNCAGRVLVVDENSDQLFLMTRWLRQAGFRVCSVSTAKAADDMLALQPPDAIVLDVMTRDHIGLDLLYRCHDLQVAVVVVTAGTWKTPTALKGSVSAELMKSFPRKEFVDVVTMAVEHGSLETAQRRGPKQSAAPQVRPASRKVQA